MRSALSGCLAAGAALAEPPSAPEKGEAPRAEDAAPVGLDALLRLPAPSAPDAEQRKGGEGPQEWRARFSRAREELATAEQALAEAQQKLESLASDRESWQVAAPGAKAGTDTGPLSFGLRQEIRRQREAVERAQRELDELRIEANLAGVPEEWTREPAAAVAPSEEPNVGAP